MTFPPTTRDTRRIDAMLGVLASVIGGHEAWYVSSPLTSGERFNEWVASGAPKDSLHARVIQPNRDEAARFVRDLRRERPVTVVDPLALADVTGWEQDDYRVFWGKVIEEYVSVVVLRQGWEFSSGCAYEYYVALGAGAAIVDERLDVLEPEWAASRLRLALARDSSNLFLRGVTDAVEKLVGQVPRPHGGV